MTYSRLVCVGLVYVSAEVVGSLRQCYYSTIHFIVVHITLDNIPGYASCDYKSEKNLSLLKRFSFHMESPSILDQKWSHWFSNKAPMTRPIGMKIVLFSIGM